MLKNNVFNKFTHDFDQKYRISKDDLYIVKRQKMDDWIL